MAALPSHARVFVINLSADADPGQGRLAGRLEHVDSGRSTQFASGDEMLEFFARILREIEGPGPPDKDENTVRNH